MVNYASLVTDLCPKYKYPVNQIHYISVEVFRVVINRCAYATNRKLKLGFIYASANKSCYT